MFTGLVEAIGKVQKRSKTPAGEMLQIKSTLSKNLKIGESIAIEGVCLTVTKKSTGLFQVNVIPETLACTTLGKMKVGQPVDLERALKMGDRLGGHFVQGHVDGTGTVEYIKKKKNGWRVQLKPPKSLLKSIPLKGSITINGVSLTVCKATSSSFEVALIPETLKSTTLASLKKGDKVNLEVDLIARYLETLLKAKSS